MKLISSLVIVAYAASSIALPTEMFDHPPWLEDELEARTEPNGACFKPAKLEPGKVRSLVPLSHSVFAYPSRIIITQIQSQTAHKNML
jgi:hypothetical protein